MEEEHDKLTIAAVFAHPDDELNVVGTLMNHSDNGDDVYVIMLTQGENASTIPGSKEDIILTRKGHAAQIEKIIGAKYIFLDIPDSGVFPSVANAKKLAKVFKQIKPDIVITWHKSKMLGVGHPDHRYTQDITIDAISYARYKNSDDEFPPHRKPISIYTYLSFDNQDHFGATFVDVTPQIDRIWKFIEVYEEAYGKWPVKEYKKASLVLFGSLGSAIYAEAFAKLEWRKAKKYLD